MMMMMMMMMMMICWGLATPVAPQVPMKNAEAYPELLQLGWPNGLGSLF